MKSVSVSAPAKIILFGEHAVVYGQPAVAAPVSDLRAFAEIKIDRKLDSPKILANDLNLEFSLSERNLPDSIKYIAQSIRFITQKLNEPLLEIPWRLTLWSQIPIARGLGSSAAINVVLIKALFSATETQYTPYALNEIAFELEKLYHGRPSGIDNTVISLEQPILFQKREKVKFLDPQELYFIIGDTGIGKKTALVVKEVAARYQANNSLYNEIFQVIGEIAREGAKSLEAGNKENLGKLMDQNQHLLQQINVSCSELDHLIDVAKKKGALGAKLCGAGKGGCMVALAGNHRQAQLIATALKEAGAINSYVSKLKKEVC